MVPRGDEDTTNAIARQPSAGRNALLWLVAPGEEEAVANMPWPQLPSKPLAVDPRILKAAIAEIESGRMDHVLRAPHNLLPQQQALQDQHLQLPMVDPTQLNVNPNPNIRVHPDPLQGTSGGTVLQALPVPGPGRGPESVDARVHPNLLPGTSAGTALQPLTVPGASGGAAGGARLSSSSPGAPSPPTDSDAHAAHAHAYAHLSLDSNGMESNSSNGFEILEPGALAGAMATLARPSDRHL